MNALPSGTVSLLFSDIEGSTVLLSRLGPVYADALDGQRQVLRTAWAAHGGTELGTEGDSFFVVFPTAPGAVAAATQAQRELAGYAWPEGERVRVRMGIHTGNPPVHDGGYVGMDVHRAARIAGAAHGGQVVVSSATAELVGAALPDGVELLDLGSHQLKDIPAPEHLFQVGIDGLAGEFPALKTLGAASSLPRPATPLVGRDGELAELAALVKTSGVRLVTLTGPGGSGKTRLGIAVAQRLVESFPDGVYFVPLATVTTTQVMWTSIAETLDVPPDGRIPPGLFTHVAQRSALLVLDNLEQIHSADEVVSRLLTEAPQVVVVATSRRPLHVAGEHEHPVPPLELPDDTSLAQAEASGAVQLFTQQAHRVRPSFGLTAENAGDVVAVCRRLDGLPLAIELTAARVKLLSPRALLARLDTALELKDTGVDRPARQQTLRDTIGWSYDLLTPDQQVFFARLGVFAGGADLDAITAVTTIDDGPDADADVLDVVADLVDASLLAVTEAADGEPRFGMLETVRAYALDQLTASGELDTMRQRHAHHYLHLAEDLDPLLVGPGRAAARARFETEHDNCREALRWAMHPDTPTTDPSDRDRLGLRLCTALGGFWFVGSSPSEGRRWTEQAIHRADDQDRPELAGCLASLALHLRKLGDLDSAYECATASVDMWRRLDDTSGLSWALVILASIIGAARGQAAAARPLLHEAVSLAREYGDRWILHVALGSLATVEGSDHDYEVSLKLRTEALDIARELADPSFVLTTQHNMACTLREMGRVEDAQKQMRELIPPTLKLNEPDGLIGLAEDYAAILAELGNHHQAVRLLGAAEATRERLATPRDPAQEAEIAEPIAKTRDALTTQEWNDAYQTGRNSTIEVTLTQAHAADAET